MEKKLRQLEEEMRTLLKKADEGVVFWEILCFSQRGKVPAIE